MLKMSDELVINQTRITLIQGDITNQDTDAIVNAANPSLRGGGGVDGAIHRAGGRAILDECTRIVKNQGPLQTGKAVLTTGGNLKARYVIHTVGPVWHGGTQNEAELLTSAYQKSLRLATTHGLSSISFPSISTGAYGYPVQEAATVALRAVALFLKHEPTSLREIIFVLFDSRTYQHYRTALEQLSEMV
ncbi:MAG: O-acetyl-ADP-ribose deacetylase [Methanophagales archaeon ANME-1-THS]|nr:MAG: O-acetyl-ADP-ribose deacetylase [Methanophagales archaeon ANME-1-THS]